MQAGYSHNGREAPGAILIGIAEGTHQSRGVRDAGALNCRQEGSLIEIYAIIAGNGRLLPSILHAERWWREDIRGRTFTRNPP